MLTEVNGNLLDMFDKGKFNLIIHGCNCQSMMGAGIAGQIATRYPKAAIADRKSFTDKMYRLGNYSDTLITLGHERFGVIVNAYTQYTGGSDFRLYALETVIPKIFTKYKSYRIGVPQIGAGIGGGDWVAIKEVLTHNAKIYNIDLTIVYYDSKNS